jgi:hypothetical protein
LTAALTIALLAVAAEPGVVLASCVPSRPHTDESIQAGVVGQPSPYPIGVYSYADEYDPYFTGHDNAGTLMSVMLDYWPYWGQVGWIKKNFGGVQQRQIFVEHVDGWGNNFWQYWAPKPVGNSTQYKIIFNPSNKHFTYYAGGSVLTDLGANFNPSRWEIFGETHDKADQFPGGYNIHARFRISKVLLYGQSTWANATGAPHHYSGVNDASHPYTGEYDVWDIACYS